VLNKVFNRILPVGSRSIIFGVHQFIWHPITVYIAWCKLYGIPNLKETVCIIIHDWGYWNSPNMDGEEGEKHTEVAAKIAGKLFGQEYYDLCLLHSRHYAKNVGKEPSKLCWADKLSIMYEPWWLYIPRAILSGEIKEYREKSAEVGIISLETSNKEWFRWVKDWLVTQGVNKESSKKLVNNNKGVDINVGI